LRKLRSFPRLPLLEVQFGARDKVELQRIKKFLNSQPIAWLESEDIRLAATYSDLRLSNGMGILDALAAALAIRLAEPLVTFNIKHFVAVPGLATIQPYIH